MHPNKSFIEKAGQILNSSLKTGNDFLLYLDITDFQYINYCYGPEAGDRLLEAVSDFTAGLPSVLLHERLYSDYFLCILTFSEQLSDEQTELLVAEYLCEFLEEQQKLYPACKLKIACGICRLNKQELYRSIENANLARKEAKRLDSGKPVFYTDEMAELIGSRYELEQSLNQALLEHRFRFYLQPKVDLISGRIIGAEALARRIDNDGNIIYPDSFLPLLESTGAIIELDMLVCRQVCAFLSERIAGNLPVVCTSVNLSRLHIKNSSTAHLLHAIAEEYHVPPALLEFELTETILLEELSGAKKLIDQLRLYGYRVSIDDFGSGYAGINIWQELDFDCLKLDACFLSEEPELKKKNEALVPNIINIGHRLNINILCEGVETAEQCHYLMRLGCTTVQGFFFSRPTTPETFYEVYRKQNGRYPVPFQETPNIAGETSEIHSISNEKTEKNSRKVRWYFPLSLCALFTGLCIILAAYFYGADKTALQSGRIINSSLYFTSALFAAIILIYLVMFLYMKNLRKKFSLEEQRYFLLGQLSDTVLFDYDCRKDTIRFTPNTGRLFKIHNLAQDNFLHELDIKYIYAGDLEVVRTLLSGKSLQKELRIRLLHPSENRYFWCLAQFRYVYEHSTLISIVGKITDIDEQKLHEDYLLETSEKV